MNGMDEFQQRLTKVAPLWPIVDGVGGAQAFQLSSGSTNVAQCG
jgi:hypothetical protein